jgi:hypothetical protein
MSLKERNCGSGVFLKRAFEAAGVSGKFDRFEPSSIEAILAEDELQPMERIVPFLPGSHQMRPAACST